MDNRRRMLMSGGSLKFFITYNGVIYEYKFTKGMTWSEFVSSSYNDGKIKVSGTAIYYITSNIEIRLNGTTVVASDIITESNYNTLAWATSNLNIYAGGTSIINGTASGKGYSIESGYIKLCCYYSRDSKDYLPAILSINNIDISGYRKLIIQSTYSSGNLSNTSCYFKTAGSSKVNIAASSSKKTYTLDITNLYGVQTITIYCDNYDEEKGSYSNGLKVYSIYLTP